MFYIYYYTAVNLVFPPFLASWWSSTEISPTHTTIWRAPAVPSALWDGSHTQTISSRPSTGCHPSGYTHRGPFTINSVTAKAFTCDRRNATPSTTGRHRHPESRPGDPIGNTPSGARIPTTFGRRTATGECSLTGRANPRHASPASSHTGGAGGTAAAARSIVQSTATADAPRSPAAAGRYRLGKPTRSTGDATRTVPTRDDAPSSDGNLSPAADSSAHADACSCATRGSRWSAGGSSAVSPATNHSAAFGSSGV